MFDKTKKSLLERMYPEFPSAEYESRYDTAQKAMEKEGLDALIVTKKNTEYFTGCMTTIGPKLGIIPRDQDPVLLIPAFLSGTAERTSWVRNIVRHTEAHLKHEEMSFAKLVVNTLTKMGLDNGTIGLEQGEDLESSLHFAEVEYLRKKLPNADFVPGGDVLWACRMRKSSTEIERLRTAASIAMKGYNTARDQLDLGMTEIEIAEVFKEVLIEEQTKEGHNTNSIGYFNIRAGSERYPMADTFNQDRPIQDGDVLVMNVGAWFRRYYANWSRYAYVGQPPDKFKKAHEAIVQAIGVFQDNLEPGAVSKEIHDKAIKPLQDCNCGETFDHTGIGVGLHIHEPPYIGHGREDVVNPDNVFCFQAWIYDVENDGMGVLGYEHEFVVTESGCKPIVPMEDELLWII